MGLWRCKRFTESSRLLAGSRVKASPYAKKLAEKAGISLDGIAGSGPDGRIVAEDVEKAVASGKVGDWCSRGLAVKK